MRNFNYLIGYIFSLMSRIIPVHLRHRLSGIILPQDMQWCIYDLKFNGFSPERVIDVGAHRGEWAKICKRVFPSAAIMMIEPQISENKFLKRFCKKHPDSFFINALVGASEKENIPFLVDGLRSRVLLDSENKSNNHIELPLATLDCLTKETPFTKSQLIKLDVQGYELEVLKGANAILDYVEVVIMEISLIQIIPGAPLFHAVIQNLHDRDYHLYDICSKFRRPIDRALWQVDAVFVRNNSLLGNVSKGWA